MHTKHCIALVAVGLLCLSAGALPPEAFIYQGRLVDENEMPITVATEVTFSFFDAAVGGNPLVNNDKLYSETDIVTPDANGIFTTIVGDNEGFGLTILDIAASDEVWMNINVEGEDLVPRQRLLTVPYAVRATTADSAETAEFAEEADNAASADMATFSINAQSSSDSDTLDGLDASDLAPVDHEHDAGDITSGFLADARILPTIARDDEVFDLVLGEDGPGSFLNADQLDGISSEGFLSVSADNWLDDDGDSAVGIYEFNNSGQDSTPVIEITNSTASAGVRGLKVTTSDTGNWVNAAGEFVARAGAGVAVSGRATGNAGIAGDFEATGDSGTGVSSAGDLRDFFADGTGVNYAPFTGSHEVRLAPGWSGEATPGLIVSASGVVAERYDEAGAVSLSSTMPEVVLADTAADKRVLGVLVAEHTLFDDHWYPAVEGDRFAMINALGEGRVWVCTANGEVNAGDYITTSTVPGFGQRQADDLQHSYTVGKVIEQVDWASVTETIVHDGVTYKARLVAVIYTCG